MFLLGVLGLALLIAVVMLAYAGTTGQAGSGVGAGSTQGPSARQALDVALATAEQRMADARLVGVSRQWFEVGVPQQDPGEWTYQFYSPSTQKLLVVAVAQGEGRVVRGPSLSPYRLETFSEELWLVDSDLAWGAWWENGGDSMVTQRPDTDVLMQLRLVGEDESRLLWLVSGILGEDTSFTVWVDAVSGEVMFAE